MVNPGVLAGGWKHRAKDAVSPEIYRVWGLIVRGPYNGVCPELLYLLWIWDAITWERINGLESRSEPSGWQLEHFSHLKISPQACIVQKLKEKIFSVTCQHYFKVRKASEVRRGHQICLSLSLASLSLLCWMRHRRGAGARPPNPAVEDCFLPCPGTKGSTRCHGTNPASSCWKQTPAPSASSACHFKLGLIPVDSARVRRAFHANETVQKWLKWIVVGLNSL